MLWEYIRKALKDSYSLDLWHLNDAFWKMTENGEWEPLFNHIFAEFCKVASNRDFIYREQGVKGFLLAYLNMSKAYTVYSETEMKVLSNISTSELLRSRPCQVRHSLRR